MKKIILLITTLATCVLLAFPACAEQYEEETRRLEPIVINPTDLWQVILAISGGIITLAGAGGVVASVIHKAKTPNQKQNERLDKVEDDIKKINARLEEGCKRFETDAKKMDDLEKTMRDSNKVIIESLQALTAHAIDGNNIDKLKTAEQTLNDYLIGKI